MLSNKKAKTLARAIGEVDTVYTTAWYAFVGVQAEVDGQEVHAAGHAVWDGVDAWNSERAQEIATGRAFGALAQRLRVLLAEQVPARAPGVARTAPEGVRVVLYVDGLSEQWRRLLEGARTGVAGGTAPD